ncbi:MAG: sugar ABC transporter ATP-binding protein, partial [Sphaerochaetaceae bacterium]
MNETILELNGINKTFPGVKALDNVSMVAKAGEVLAICGENGAGKSTLMKIINGNYVADSGEIKIKGKKVNITSPLVARQNGIAMIFQECNYIPELSVAEAMYLGHLPVNKFHQVDWKAIHTNTEALLKAEGLYNNSRLIDGINTKLKYLSIADIQMLEIIKAISQNSQILIMDEPTSSISTKEADELLKKVLDLKNRGKCIIYISHKMDEIFKIADSIAVFRDGKSIMTKATTDWSVEEVIKTMVGRELSNNYPKENVEIGRTLLEVENLHSTGIFSNINFTVHAGEIIGFAGLVGAGRTEVVRAVSGLDHFDDGKIKVDGKEIVVKSVNDSTKHGIAMLSEDRRRYGLVPIRCVRENISLPNLKRYFFKGRWHEKKEISEATKQVDSLRIKTPSLESQVANLSGGNQQKVVLAKWLLKDPKILILDEPTRGIDVGAKYEIYRLMTRIAKEGKGIVMVSSEMPELLGMCDRIYVMATGKMTTVLN